MRRGTWVLLLLLSVAAACDEKPSAAPQAVAVAPVVVSVDAAPPGLSGEAAEWARRCEGGDSVACGKLAEAHLGGEDGAPRDIGKARDLYHRACDTLADADACGSLAVLYREGDFDGVRDPVLVFKYLARECELAPGAACTSVGFRYLEGNGVARDLVKGRAILEKQCRTTASQVACVGLLRAHDDKVVALDTKTIAGLRKRACELGVEDFCH